MIKEEKEQATIFERVKNLITTNAEEHKQILVQVIKTNGTVTGLVKLKERIIGGLIISNIIIVPIMITLILKLFKNN